MAYDVTSQWDDIHRKLGNYEELPHETKQFEFSKAAIQKLEDYDPLSHKTLDELDELEDDLDEEFLNQYKQQRLKEITEEKAKPKFVGLREISRQDYIDEVTNAEKDTFVVLHLYQSFVETCTLINQVLDQLSHIHRNIKFLKIVSTKCIENYPDTHVPTIIVYKNGKMLHTIERVDKRYTKITQASMEHFLQALGVLPKQDKTEQETMKALKGRK
jgi:hypothetical protein